MVNFKFTKGGRKCIRQILQAYQTGWIVQYILKRRRENKDNFKIPIKARVLVTLLDLWRRNFRFQIIRWNKLNFYTIQNKGW